MPFGKVRHNWRVESSLILRNSAKLAEAVPINSMHVFEKYANVITESPKLHEK